MPPPPAPPPWSAIPNKFQLAIICSIRIVDFFQQAALQTYMFYQLASFAPDAAESQISFQVGVLQGVFTAAQVFTSIFWGRIADHPSWGRKRVIMISLVGQAISCLGVAFSRSFASAVVWRCLGGAVNATVGGARTCLSECTEKKYHPKTFLLLPLAWNLANIVAPPVGGLMSDPVRFHPGWFGEDSTFGGRNGVVWMKMFPYAAPNIFCALLLFADAALVFFGLRETLISRKDKPDWGREFATTIQYQIEYAIFQRFGYSRINQVDTNQDHDLEDDANTVASTPMSAVPPKTEPAVEGISSSTANIATAVPKKAAPPFREALTRNVLLVLSTVAFLDFQLGGFTALWTMFLSTDRRQPSEKVFLPFNFTGGLGFKPSLVGLAMSILGVVGILCQLMLYPRVNARFGLVNSTKYALFIFPLAYIIAPYLSLLISVQFLLWIGIIGVAFLGIFARTFAIPGIVLLTNNASPSPELLGTIHGMGAAVSSAFRTIGPTVAGHWYSQGLERGRVGEAWWLIAVVALMGCVPVFWVRDGAK